MGKKQFLRECATHWAGASWEPFYSRGRTVSPRGRAQRALTLYIMELCPLGRSLRGQKKKLKPAFCVLSWWAGSGVTSRKREREACERLSWPSCVRSRPSNGPNKSPVTMGNQNRGGDRKRDVASRGLPSRGSLLVTNELALNKQFSWGGGAFSGAFWSPLSTRRAGTNQ